MPPSSKFADINFPKMLVEHITPDLSGLRSGVLPTGKGAHSTRNQRLQQLMMGSTM
jgi:hypothetical protein